MTLTIPKDMIERRITETKARDGQKRSQSLQDAKDTLAKIARLAPRALEVPSEEKLCPASLPEAIDYLEVDAKFFEYFVSGSYAKTAPLAESWFHSYKMTNLVNRLDRQTSPDNVDTWDEAALFEIKDAWVSSPYVLILNPSGGFAWPKVNEKLGAFVPGYFEGWQTLADANTGEILCRNPLRAQNSDSVEFRTYKLRHLIKVYDNAEKKTREDLTEAFWTAVKNNLRKRSGS